MYNLPIIVITGPTAVGKTKLAAALAYKINGEIISADSRQVYRQMDIGTGKDLEDYMVNGQQIPYHLIDICDAGEKYDVFRFKEDFTKTAKEIQSRGKAVILCGGTGMYIDAVVRNYNLQKVPENTALRELLEQQSLNSLVKRLKSLKPLHNTTDINDKERLIRAIEIAEFEKYLSPKQDNPFTFRVFVIAAERTLVKQQITERLKKRLSNGMVEEVEMLLKNGIKKETLHYYGLEYRFIAMYLCGEINYNDMFQKLNSAIHDFAKRQVTFLRSMEKKGVKINQVEYSLSLEEKTDYIYHLIK